MPLTGGGPQGVRVVRDEHDGWVPVQTPTVVHEPKVDCGATWAEHLGRRLQQGLRFGASVRRLLNRVAVDPERDVVEKQAAVHLRHVDDALDSVGERFERTD